jgi:hypothetical protein
MKSIKNKPTTQQPANPKYTEEELLLFATSQRNRKPSEYGPIVKGSLNNNKMLVTDYEAYMRKKK